MRYRFLIQVTEDDNEPLREMFSATALTMDELLDMMQSFIDKRRPGPPEQPGPPGA